MVGNIQEKLEQRLAKAPVVPLIGANDTGVAVETAKTFMARKHNQGATA